MMDLIRILNISELSGHIFILWMNNRRRGFYSSAQDQIEFQWED